MGPKDSWPTLVQVYLALALLVEAGGGDVGKALAAADAEFAALAPDAKSKVCWDPACKAPVLLGCPAAVQMLPQRNPSKPQQ